MSDEKLLDDKLIENWKPEEVEWNVLCFLKDGRSFLVILNLPTEQFAKRVIKDFEIILTQCHPDKPLAHPSSPIVPIPNAYVRDYSHSIPIPRRKS